eukprot:1395457-Amorphochlora_amoeboformis.AAC.1
MGIFSGPEGDARISWNRGGSVTLRLAGLKLSYPASAGMNLHAGVRDLLSSLCESEVIRVNVVIMPTAQNSKSAPTYPNTFEPCACEGLLKYPVAYLSLHQRLIELTFDPRSRKDDKPLPALPTKPTTIEEFSTPAEVPWACHTRRMRARTIGGQTKAAMKHSNDFK